MQKYNISAALVCPIGHLYDNAISAVQTNGSTGERSHLRKSSFIVLFNIILARVMFVTLEEHDGKVTIGRRTITNLRFSDDIDAFAGEEQEQKASDKSLDKTCTRYKTEWVLKDQTNDKQRQWHPEGVTSVKSLGEIVSDEG